MTFDIRDGLILFNSERPGSHATMFGPIGKLPFKNSASRFSDEDRSYTWAFMYDDSVTDGMLFIFATSEFEIVGQVKDGEIEVIDCPDVTIVREDGKPLVPLHHGPQKPVVVRSRRAREAMLGLDKPKVSVITCTYNRPKMLRECVDVVRQQTERNWEHLIYDDASNDVAVEDALTWAEEDPRVRVWRGTSNIDQPARGWNMMLDRVRGRYICFLDDDNSKSTEFFEILGRVLDDNLEIDMVTCGFTVIEPPEKPSDNHLNLVTAQELWRRNTVDTGAFLIRREAFERIGYFPLDIRTNEDWAMMRRAHACLNIKHLSECLVTYRVHEGQRMKRSASLGNQGDKIRIEGSGWAGVYGVTVRGGQNGDGESPVAAGVKAALKDIRWVSDGPELTIILSSTLDAVVHATASAKGAVLLMCTDDDTHPENVESNVETARAMARFNKDAWVLTSNVASMAAYQRVLEGRVIACPNLSTDKPPRTAAGWRTRMARAINAVRSPRFEAVIP